MSFETRVPVTLHFNHKTYDDTYDVYDDLDDLKSIIRDYENQLLALAAGSPREMLNCFDCENVPMDPMDILTNKVTSILTNYKESLQEKWKLEMLLDNFEKREGDFINRTDFNQ